jgi:PPOX class probable FMN-dependent enzyme
VYEFKQVISDPGTLRKVLGKPHGVVVQKTLSALDDHCRKFIARCPFVLVASSDAAGRFDVSPKGDPAGFVRVLDDHTLVIPERLGNRRADTFHNVLERPDVGLIFLIPGKMETLRVSGTARVVQDPEVLEPMAVKGKIPQMALAVHVTEAFFHCSKCMVRSALWSPDSWPSLEGLPTLAQTMVSDGKSKLPAPVLDVFVKRDEKKRLY